MKNILRLKMLAKYQDLVTYWSQDIRVITSWQTKEFIAARLLECRKMVLHFSN